MLRVLRFIQVLLISMKNGLLHRLSIIIQVMSNHITWIVHVQVRTLALTETLATHHKTIKL